MKRGSSGRPRVGIPPPPFSDEAVFGDKDNADILK